MRIKNLYSKDPLKRYNASLRFEKAYPDAIELWPRGCSGAPNGWLMLVGPSPGKADSIKSLSKGGLNRPCDKRVKIGTNSGKFSFKTGKQRNNGWNKLAESVFDNIEHAGSLTSRTNLDWGNYSKSQEIPKENLILGCSVVFGLMKSSHPRIIVVLSKRAWKPLTDYLKFCIIECIDKQPTDAYTIQMPNCSFKTLILRSPQHPSMPYFSDLHCEQISKTVKWFLKNHN